MSEQASEYQRSEISQPLQSKKPTIRPQSAIQSTQSENNIKRPTTAKIKTSQLQQTLMDKDKTHPFFKETKVGACAHVVVVGGVPKAVPFYTQPKKDPASQTKLGFGQSFSQEQFKMHPLVTLGSKHKPLVPYHPDSQRNRMPLPVMKMPQTNQSQIQFGDGTANKRQFVSSGKNNYGNHPSFGFITNPAILSSMTSKHKGSQAK